MDKLNITGIIIARNEEQNISYAIRSLDFCQELIVADDSSEDQTPDISFSKGAKVIVLPSGLNFAEKRNFALRYITSEWALFLDADETISEDLKTEIANVITNDNSPVAAYQIKRRDFFWGKELKWGETLKARRQGIIRLVKRNKGRWEGGVHEIWTTKEKVGRFKNYIDHSPHQTLKEFIAKVNHYSTLRAQDLISEGERPSLTKILFFPPAKFILTYFCYLGFLDGAEGFIYSFVMSFHSFLVRSKILQKLKINDTSI